MEQHSILAARLQAATDRSRTPPFRGPSLEHAALALVYLVSVVSLVGFATFGRHPERLITVPDAARVYGWMLLVAPKAQIVIAFAALAAFLTRRVGARWLPAFAALYLVSLASELAGTTVGLPFGPYHYTNGLGAKWFGHVPVLIPVSWFYMALPSYAIAFRRFPFPSQRIRRVAVASLVLLSWDLVLDPAMSLVTQYWVWGTTGPYYGMPLVNLVGWFATGVALMIALTLVRADAWIAQLPTRWLVAFYGANLLLPVAMSIVAGLWGAIAATAAALACCWFATRDRVAPLANGGAK
jgi:putative membrane protein